MERLHEIANYYFNNQTNYLVSYFAVDKDYLPKMIIFVKNQ